MSLGPRPTLRLLLLGGIAARFRTVGRLMPAGEVATGRRLSCISALTFCSFVSGVHCSFCIFLETIAFWHAPGRAQDSNLMAMQSMEMSLSPVSRLVFCFQSWMLLVMADRLFHIMVVKRLMRRPLQGTVDQVA